MNAAAATALKVGDAFHYARFDNATRNAPPTVTVESATVGAISPSGMIAAGKKAVRGGSARWDYAFHEVAGGDSAIPAAARFAYAGTRGAYPTRQGVLDALRRGAERSLSDLRDEIAEAQAWLESLPAE